MFLILIKYNIQKKVKNSIFLIRGYIMIFDIEKDGEIYKIGESFSSKPPSKAGLKEKDIENWVAKHPEILFPNEEILTFGQSISGLSMADVLALDARGNLIIIEIKRDWSDRSTVGQLLEYAARLSNSNYDFLNKIASQCSILVDDLYTSFVKFSENKNIDKETIGKQQRILVVAHESDENLKTIINWLRQYHVPIEFVSYSIYVDQEGKPKFLDIEGIKDSPDLSPSNDHWIGHWIFNTNEKNSLGAYQKMFKENVAAIYGYSTGSKNLEGSRAGDTVFAYVNGQGIRAIGTVVTGEVKSGTNIFLDKYGVQLPDEYHLEVNWHIVVSKENALSANEAASFGYNLPVRTVFGKLHKGSIAKKLEQTIINKTKITNNDKTVVIGSSL
jgi:hypothetical protein